MPEVHHRSVTSESTVPLPADPPGRLLKVVAWQLLLPTCGVLLAWYLLVYAFLPIFGFGEMNRLVRVGEHLQEVRHDEEPYICALGSSIVQNGLDGRIIEEAYGRQSRVENLADPGAKLWDHLTKLPLVLEAHPETVLIGVGPNDHFDHVIANDKRFAMSVVGFIDAWSPSYAAELPAELSEKQLAVDALPDWRKWLHFRVIPILWINGQSRQLLRRDYLREADRDFVAPHTYERPISSEQLETHLRQMRAAWQKGVAVQVENRSAYRQLARVTRAAGATPVFLIYPIHPEIRDAAAPLIELIRADIDASAAEHGTQIIDGTQLLQAEDYVDALHPNESGRAKWSRYIGAALAAKESPPGSGP